MIKIVYISFVFSNYINLYIYIYICIFCFLLDMSKRKKSIHLLTQQTHHHILAKAQKFESSVSSLYGD